jgi:hypothetical protein
MGVRLRIHLDSMMENVGLTRTHTLSTCNSSQNGERCELVGKWLCRFLCGTEFWELLLLEHANRQLRVSHVRLISWLHLNISSRYISVFILLHIIWFVADLFRWENVSVQSARSSHSRDLCAAVWMPFILGLVFLVYPISSCEFQLIFSVCLPPPPSKENRGKLFLLGQI